MSPSLHAPTPLKISDCPNCHRQLSLRKLVCADCDLTLEGTFTPYSTSQASNEFSSLPDDDLHLLRIFVHCEGSIREMESALGLSYPTIKARLAKLRDRLKHSAPIVAPETEPTFEAAAIANRKVTSFSSVENVLEALERGEITAAESVQYIRKIRGV
jgi:hypothetical protein